MDDLMEDAVRRDRWGRYLVVPPDGGKPVGYARATTVAKTLDDTSALMSWGERMTAIGLSQRPDLLAQIDDLRADTKALNRLCEKAKEAGGATVRRDLGTALHSILERSWTDPDYVPPAGHVDDVTAVHRALELAGLEAVDGMHERIVVNDRYQIAGTFDLLLREKATGHLLIADIKTGSSVKYGAVGFAIQLSIYATADALYRQGSAKDGSEDVREPMVSVSRDRAVIVHVQPGSGVCELHELALDISLLELAIAVRESRKAKVLRPIDIPTDTSVEVSAEVSVERDRWLRDRIDAIKDRNGQMLAQRWPAHIPPPKKIAVYADPQIDELVPIVDGLERDLELPFGASDPAQQQETQRSQPIVEPAGSDPEEGPLLPGEADELRERFERLSENERARIAQIASEAKQAGLPIRVSERPTARRVHLASALMYAIQFRLTDMDLRRLLEIVLDDDSVLMATLPLGAALGACSYTQAAELRDLTALGTTVTTGGDNNE